MSIYITGDMHGDIDIHKFSADKFSEGKTLTKDDYVIILGDFGLIWNLGNTDLYWLKWLTEKPWTTLFVDGNHENFDLLKTFPYEDKFNGKVQRITNSIFHLCRGEIYTIEDQTFFVMGGAQSTDKEFRRSFISWWPQELPTHQEFDSGLRNLEKYDFNVDYILSHCTGTTIKKHFFPYMSDHDSLTDYLDAVYSETTFKGAFFGHYHEDVSISKYHCLYNKIVKL